jgi:hypothetical protein
MLWATLLVLATPTVDAAKGEAKPSAKRASKAEARPAAKRASKVKASPARKSAPVLRGRTETLTCRNGTEDRHARIGVVLVGGRAESFAYYSKWKPRTCSIYLQRNRDGHSRWSDEGDVTRVKLERGWFLIEHHRGEYRFVFRDIDRERYCGMDGTINGTLTIRKGSEHCELTGIMEEGVPLGQAVAHMEQQAREAQQAQQASTSIPAASTGANAITQPVARSRYRYDPSDTVVIGD